MTVHDRKKRIMIFNPLPGTMRDEVSVIALLMLAWLTAVVGTQIGIWFLESSIKGFWLTELIFFNLPIHFWISGQFLPLLFIVLCLVFNLWMDRHETRRMESSIRFRSHGRKKGEVD